MTWKSVKKNPGRGYRAAEPSAPPPRAPKPARVSVEKAAPPPKPGFNPLPTAGLEPMGPSRNPPRTPVPGAEWVPRPGRPGPESAPRPGIPGLDPLPTSSFIPKGNIPTYEPPGGGVGLEPGPAPALGRPGLLPKDHGAWKNESCYARGSKGWKPDILTIGDAHSYKPGMSRKGPLGMRNPPNFTGNPAGYNTALFRYERDVALVLHELGYEGADGTYMLRQFQRDWNSVSTRVGLQTERFAHVNLRFQMQGNLKVDGEIGPHSLNAMEAALGDQESSGVPWSDFVKASRSHDDGYNRRRLYNAAEGA